MDYILYANPQSAWVLDPRVLTIAWLLDPSLATTAEDYRMSLWKVLHAE